MTSALQQFRIQAALTALSILLLMLPPAAKLGLNFVPQVLAVMFVRRYMPIARRGPYLRGTQLMHIWFCAALIGFSHAAPALAVVVGLLLTALEFAWWPTPSAWRAA